MHPTAQLPVLAYTAVLGLDSASAADLARLAFGALLWIALVVVNRGASDASPSPPALEVEGMTRPRRRLEHLEPEQDGVNPREAA